MAKNYSFLVCILVMVMDVIAGILGIQAEIAQNKVKDLKMWVFECRDPSYEAFKLGLAATILLALAHVIANLIGGCICMWSREDFQRSPANRQLAMVFLNISWIILVVAFSMLITGTLANSNSRSRESCGITNHRFLSIGGILCFFHALFTVAYFVSTTATRREEKSHVLAGTQKHQCLSASHLINLQPVSCFALSVLRPESIPEKLEFHGGRLRHPHGP